MTKLATLEIYELVNKCETFEQLAKVIELVGAHNNGSINGLSRDFRTKELAYYCRHFRELPDPNLLTRAYGIRQQAFYIEYYDKRKEKITDIIKDIT